MARKTMIVTADQAARLNALLSERNNGDPFVPMDAVHDDDGTVTKAATRYWCSWDPDAYGDPNNPVAAKLVDGRLDFDDLLTAETKTTATREADVDTRATLLVAEGIDPVRVRQKYEVRTAEPKVERR